MVGHGVLRASLDDPAVDEVTALARRPLGFAHPKLRCVQHDDFTELRARVPDLRGHDALFDCLGVSSIGMKEAEYARITHDMALAAASAMLEANPQSVFTYVTGAGTDPEGRAMWARVKGRAEQELLALPFGHVFMFRPALLTPDRTFRHPSRTSRVLFGALRPAGRFLMQRFPGTASSTERVGRAMIESVENPPQRRILESRDINALAHRRESRFRPRPDPA
jgi:uncharacterized protein YbjT (DUF2867 family)